MNFYFGRDTEMKIKIRFWRKEENQFIRKRKDHENVPPSPVGDIHFFWSWPPPLDFQSNSDYRNVRTCEPLFFSCIRAWNLPWPPRIFHFFALNPPGNPCFFLNFWCTPLEFPIHILNRGVTIFFLENLNERWWVIKFYS